MRVCHSCGRENPDASDFCTCGEYLRWEPTDYAKAVSPTPSAAVPEQPVEATSPARNGQVDPSVTLAPAAMRPDYEPARPGEGAHGSAMLTLRLPDELEASEGPVETSVGPGARATIVGVIRNQSDVVDNFDLALRGLPDGWWTVTPATAYLVPYGTAGTYEQQFEIHVHPPRAPEAQARAWPFEVVAASRAYGDEVSASPATVTIEPYFEIAAELRPERASGRLKGQYKLTVHNRANARAQVALNAEDSDGECQFRFAEPSIGIEPGNAIECPFTCFPPRQIWLGRTLERRFEVVTAPIGVEPPAQPPALNAIFRQRAWLPWWLAIVVPILVALVILLISLLPKPTVVPDLRHAKSVLAAQKLLNSAGLQLAPRTPTVVDASKTPGAIADQTPRPGTKAKRGTIVTVAVYAGTGMAAVPSVVGMTPGLADKALRASKLTLGAVNPQPLNPAGKIESQIPLAGSKVATGTPVAVFMAPPAAVGGKPSRRGRSSSAARAASASTPAALAAVAAQAGKGPITVPVVQGDPTVAAGRLSQLGLVPVPIKRLATVPVGQLAGTVPVAGSKVARGAQVDLLISSGSPELSYDDGQAVRVIDPTTGKRAGTVPAGVGPQVEAAWSADGTHLVVSEAGQLELVQPGSPGAKPFMLTQPPPGTADVNPAFAPTTKALIIAFVERSAKRAQLCFATIGRFALNSDCTSAPGWDLGGQVDWSPDGSTILLLGTRNHGANFGLLAFTSNVPFSTHASDWGHGSLQTNASVAGQGVFAGAFSPDGKRMALVSNIGSADFHLYVAPVGNYSATPAEQLPVRACQVSWRSDSQELAVMQPDGLCSPTATGTLVGIDLSDPRRPTILATHAAHPSWQPVPSGG